MIKLEIKLLAVILVVMSLSFAFKTFNTPANSNNISSSTANHYIVTNSK